MKARKVGVVAPGSTPVQGATHHEVVGGPMWITGWRRSVFPSVFLVYLLQTWFGVAEYSSGIGAAIGYLALIGFCVSYILALPARWDDRDRQFWMYFAVMAGCFLIEVPFAHEDAFVMCTFIAILAIASGTRWAVPGSLAMALAALLVPPAIPSWHAAAGTASCISLLLVSLSMWAFFSVIRANRALMEARAEVAGMAADNERNRIARDLHDLLGHSLTTITVKAALAKRLSEHDPARAAIEIGEVEELARRALTDVRAAVSNYSHISLAGELATGQEVLRAAGIEGRLLSPTDVVDPDLGELFGWVVREGVTNVVRHSRATHCTITLDRRSLELVDDGRGTSRVGGASPNERLGAGNGLRGIGERVAAVGGTVTSGPGDDGGWRLAVHVPVPTPSGASAPVLTESPADDGGPTRAIVDVVRPRP